MLKHTHKLILSSLMALLPLFCSQAATENQNLSMSSGAKLSSDSHYMSFLPANAADGDKKSKASRWVSKDTSGEHWLKVDFGKKQKFNCVKMSFWDKRYTPIDFDIQIKTPSDWKTIKAIRNNAKPVVGYVFKTVSATAMRVLFKKSRFDNMIRVFELEIYNMDIPLEIKLSDAFGDGILRKNRPKELFIQNYSDKAETFSVTASYLSIPDGKVVASVNKKLEIKEKYTVKLPEIPSYGHYKYKIEFTRNGKPFFSESSSFFFVPPSKSSFATSSPFGAHYHNISPVYINYLGLSWWRNHDIYGRWYIYDDGKGGKHWNKLQKKLDFVKASNIRECFVFLGAPEKYSSILPGEHVDQRTLSLYSYYPPSNLNHWLSDYIGSVTKMVKKAAEFRAYEVWNEAWSYYRLRGLRGTPGEALEIFKVTYEALKKIDPKMMSYATDVKPEMIESRYAFKNFGRDLLELGYLRYSDLISYHGYGMTKFENIEKIRLNAWKFGRDYEMWSTETAVEGKPFYALMESLTRYRAYGNGKTFIYTGSLWAPLVKNNAPSMYLMAQAALIRYLGDALPMGYDESGKTRMYLFANGSHPVAILFNDSKSPVKISLPLANNTQVLDVFNRQLDPTQKILSVNNPVAVVNPPLSLVKQSLAKMISSHSDKLGSKYIKAIARSIANASDKNLLAVVTAADKSLRKRRYKGNADFLYSSNKVMDLLINCRIMLSRANKASVKCQSLDSMRKREAAIWQKIIAKTGNNGILPNTERLTSRCRKQLQYAMMYADDKDPIGRDIMIASAADNLSNAAARLKKETISRIYKSKAYFRSHKRFIRSERYCFSGGKPQEAIITLANPFGHELSGVLKLTLPEGWTADSTQIAYTVEPISRTLIKVMLTAPQNAKNGWKGKIVIKDRNGNFPIIKADCEIVGKVPAYPILRGKISGGTFTGN